MSSNALLDSSNDCDIDGLFEELRFKLLQLDRKNLQNEQQSEDIQRISREKNRGCREFEKLGVENQDLRDQLNRHRNAATRAEAERNLLRDQNTRLTTQNEQLLAECSNLAASNKKLLRDATELQKNHATLLTKISTWSKVQQEVSQKQSHNTLTMMDLVKRIGHAKATSLYVHQLKQQVDATYKTSHDNIQRLMKLNSTARTDSAINQQSGSNGAEAISTSSNGSELKQAPESYSRTMSEQLKTVLQGYKDELWTGLHTLDSLGGDSQRTSSTNKDNQLK